MNLPLHRFLAFFVFVITSKFLAGQLVISNQGGTATAVVTAMVGGGLTVSNATITCPSTAYGTFTNGASTNIGIPSGIVLTTGNVNNLNGSGSTFWSTDNPGGNCSDAQLGSLESLADYDCCILEFDVTPSCTTLQIRFVFGSEEYPEWVSAGYNDAFGFFVTGPNPSGGNYNNTNVATLPNNTTIVSIDNVNANTNSGYYVNNSTGNSVVLDAFTTVLTRNVSVTPCQTYHFKLAIADAGDGIYDSGVFIDFLDCLNSVSATTSTTPVSCSGNDGTATANVTGGYPPYTYSWNTTPAQTTATATGLAPGTYTVTIDDAGACTNPITQTVTVANGASATTPTFTQVPPICSGGTFTLPTTSNNGIIGTWAPAINNTATTTYTFTPNTGQCATTTTMSVTVNPTVTPTFNQVAPICTGGTFTLPSASTNSITGTWSPAINNTTTTTYTFTPNSGQCALTQSMTVAVGAPSTPTFTQVGPYCSGATISALPTTSNEGFTGTWSPALNNTSTTTYAFTPTTGQCANSQSMTVTINPLVTPTFTQVSPICSGGSFTLPTTSTNSITGSWSPAINNTTTSTYTFIPTAGQCANNQTMTVTVNPVPTLSISSATICSGQSATLTATPNLTGGTFSWDSGEASNTITQSPSATTVYIATYTLNGCTSQQASGTITVNPVPTVSVNSSTICDGESATLTATGIASGGIYSWSPGGSTSNTITITTSTTTTYTVIYTLNGCSSAPSSGTVTVNPIPTVTILENPTICQGQSTSLTASPNLPGGSFVWSPGNLTTNPLTVNPNTTTVYSVIYTLNGCVSSPANSTVTVNPNVPVNAGEDVTICAGESVILTGSGTPSIEWSNNMVDGQAFTPSQTEIYVVTGTSANGCVTTDTVVVNVNPLPVISAGNPQTVCVGQQVTLSGSGAGPGGTYSWDNGVQNGIPFSVYSTQTYTLTGTDANGCVGQSQVIITGLPIPDAIFSPDVTTGAIPLTVNFTNSSTNATSYIWDFGNNNSENTNSLAATSATYSTIGVYTVWLVASNGYCEDSTSTIININLPPWIFVPNVFTPNEDGGNETWMVQTKNMSTIDLIILNRWGNVMAKIEDLNGGWDGKTPSGNDASDGTYFYKYTAKALNGEEFSGHGFLTLIR